MSGVESGLAIETRALTKRYGALTAVDGVDLQVQPGECVGILGPNGAGKTTVVKMITCFSPITSGNAFVFGMDVVGHPREVKRVLGICAQEDNLDPDFSVFMNLLVYARYFSIPRAEARRRADELLAFMQLTEKRKSEVGELSGGMKRRLVLARALLNRPRLLVLDEPTTGLDPQARLLIWERIRELERSGVTVLLTTHYMEEASRLCDRVILMDEGRILLQGPPDELVAREAGKEVIELWNLEPEVREFLDGTSWRMEHGPARVFIYDEEGGRIALEIAARFPHQERLIRHASLEDVFLLRTGRTLRE